MVLRRSKWKPLGIKTYTLLALGLASWMVTIFCVQIFVCSRRSLTEMCCIPFFQMINGGKVCEMLDYHLVVQTQW
jgi:hypothetical protein